jgi:hypothetical protein
MPVFDLYIGIDYSGAQTPTSSLKGLRIYMADRKSLPIGVQPPPSPCKYWTRRGIAEWLVERLSEEKPTLVGIDHGFSFPLHYFETHRLALSTSVQKSDDVFFRGQAATFCRHSVASIRARSSTRSRRVNFH